MGAEATLQDVAAPAAVARASWLRRRRPRRPRDATRSFALTFLMVAILAAFLSPVLRAVMVSLKTPDQLSETNAPFLPSLPQTFDWQGKTYDIYVVPLEGGSRPMALVKPGRTQSQFVDPANPSAAADRVGRRVADARTVVDAGAGVGELLGRLGDHRLPAGCCSTRSRIAVIGMIGTVVSCTLVAYGFARFRFPGRTLLFTLLIATIFLPARRDPHPDVHDLRQDRLGRDLAAAARPDVLRQRVRRVPAPPVHADDPARDGRGRRRSTAPARSGR